MTNQYIRKVLTVLLITLLANLAILLSGEPLIRYLGAYLLVFILPGFGVVRLVLGHRHNLTLLENTLLSLGAGYPVAIIATLLANYIPGKFTLPLGLAFYSAAVLIPWLISPGGKDKNNAEHSQFDPPPISIVLLAIIIIISIFFLFTNLGYSEFQGDEVMALLDGGNAIQGDDSALFFHRKGPVEIMLPVSLWVLTGTITEWMARLPFAIAGLLSILTAYILGRRVFNEWTGLVAAIFMAINGYLIGFSRIVQYQSIIMMTTAMAIFCFYVFSRNGLPRYQIMGAVFVAAGLLSHYDGIFALPVIAYLYWSLPGRFKAIWRFRYTFLIALIVGIGLLGLFYIPFLQPVYFSQTSEYIQFRSGGKLFYNNLALWFRTSTTYNSTYFVICLLGLLIISVIDRIRQLDEHRRWLSFILGPALLAIVHNLFYPDIWRTDSYDLSIVPFLIAGIVIFLIFRPSIPAKGIQRFGASIALQMSWLWFVVPFITYCFLVKRPGTHFWTMYTGLVLLGAFGSYIIKLWFQNQTRNSHFLVTVAAVASVALLAILAYYPYTVFIRTYPEFRSDYSRARSPIYWTAYKDLPARDYFGFPHRAGWKAIGVLYDRGILEGEYSSNEGGEITAWYLPEAPRHYCKPRPRYFFEAVSVQDPAEQGISGEQLAGDFSQVGIVTSQGRPGIRIYERGASPEDVVEYRVEDFQHAFDREKRACNQLAVMKQFIDTPLTVNFDQLVELAGYDFDASRVCSGGELIVTLYWQRKGPPIRESYKVFVHLENDQFRAQADDIPGCAAWPTNSWRAGEIVADRHIIELQEGLPAGEYTLSIGLYEPEQGIRLNRLDEMGQPIGDHFRLFISVLDDCSVVIKD